MLIKQDSITSQKPGSRHFWRIANSIHNKSKSSIPRVLYFASDKAKLFVENFSKSSNFVDSGIYLPAVPPVSPKLIKKVITNLDSSKTSGPDCIPVVVLKKYEPGFSYILAEGLNMCLKKSRFPDCTKFSSVVPVFKNVGERSRAKNCRPVSLLLVKSLKIL